MNNDQDICKPQDYVHVMLEAVAPFNMTEAVAPSNMHEYIRIMMPVVEKLFFPPRQSGAMFSICSTASKEEAMYGVFSKIKKLQVLKVDGLKDGFQVTWTFLE